MLSTCVIFSLLNALLRADVSETAPADAAADRSLRTLTWNIQGCARGLDSVLDELRRHDAEIICLQEAEVGTQHSGGADQAALIAEKLRLHQTSAGSAFAKGGGEQRMAILARHPLERPEPLDAGTGRIYGITAIVRFEATPVRLVCLHLTNSYWRGPRQIARADNAPVREAADLVRRLKAWGSPIILTGDFNAIPGMREHTLIAAQLNRVPSTQPTYPVEKPILAVDHIYFSADLRLARYTVLDSKASDHLPLVAELKIAPTPPTPAPARAQ